MSKKSNTLLLSVIFIAGTAKAQQKSDFLIKESVVSKSDSVSKPAVQKRLQAVVDPGFTIDSTGLDYKWITRGTDTQTARVGDFGEMNVVFKIGDTIMINTLEMNNHMPVPQQFQAPSMKGDLMGGLLKMKAGDSVVFRMLMDTLAERANQPKPNWVKPGDYATWEVKMVSIKTKDQMEAATLEKENRQLAIDDKILTEYFKSHKIQNVKKTASGLYYTILKQGSGTLPKTGQRVTVNYTGKRLDGVKFDSNVEPAFNHVEPFSFLLGKRNVIKGWDEAIALMKKGTKATFYIPSTLAYGDRNGDEKIPPNSILIFDIELLSFK
ncbi:FKBP-type peptidyl-prolyl cis-trans isomerase [Taibaiella lutea]|nr:FKBP-type peptidyl-prolyl cis-trans isomerase [Taibaiella lutea]